MERWSKAAARALAGRVRGGAGEVRRAGGRGPVRRRVLLARPRRLHLEHPHQRGPQRDPGDARRDAARDAGRPRSRSATTRRPTAGSPSRPRSAAAAATCASRGGKCFTLLTTLQELKGFEERRETARDDRAESRLRRHRRRRAGRHRARRAPEAPRRAGGGAGEERARRRLVAQALQVARAARPGLVRPPAVHAVSRALAGVHAEGPHGRLARGVRRRRWTSTTAARAVSPSATLSMKPRRNGPSRTRTAAAARCSSRSTSSSPPACRACRTCRAFPARDFKGRMLHSSRYDGGEAWRGKKCVVVGSGTSAHDICLDLADNGADVTMVQRAPTIVGALGEPDGSRLGPALLRAGGRERHQHRRSPTSPWLAFRSRCCPGCRTPIYEQIAKRDADLYGASPRPASSTTSAPTAPASTRSTCGAAPATTSRSAPRRRSSRAGSS